MLVELVVVCVDLVEVELKSSPHWRLGEKVEVQLKHGVVSSLAWLRKGESSTISF